jgi:GxxExxY protein
MGYLYQELSSKVYDCIFEVHRTLGPGLLESVYEICLKKELEDRGIKVEQQKALPVIYKGVALDTSYRIDLWVEDKIILELKAVEVMSPIFQAQLLTYMKLANCSLGFLVNFNVPLIKNGIIRMVL